MLLPNITITDRHGQGWWRLDRTIKVSTASRTKPKPSPTFPTYRFIQEHFSDSFRLSETTPPRPGAQSPNWINAASVLENNEISEVPELPEPPQTPDHKPAFLPSFSISTPGGDSPRSLKSSTSSGSPLVGLQYTRRIDRQTPSVMSPVVSPTKSRPRNSLSGTPARTHVWRP